MHNVTSLVLIAATILAIGLVALWARGFSKPPRIFHLCNLGVSTHHGGKSFFADAAFSSRYLLATLGSDQDHCDVCGASDIPLGPATDEVATADIAAVPINVALLGIKDETLPMIASEAIDAGEAVYTAANGKVQDLPAGAGTYYKVGYALTAAAADGDPIEVQHCAPTATVVT